MLGLYKGTAELARLKAAEEDGSPGRFGVALEHIRTLLQNDDRRRKRRDLDLRGDQGRAVGGGRADAPFPENHGHMTATRKLTCVELTTRYIARGQKYTRNDIENERPDDHVF